MEKIHRGSGDMSGAFVQASKGGVVPSIPSATPAEPAAPTAPSAHNSLKHLVKRILRRMAGIAWRGVRPIARGPIHRVRRFLAEPMTEELRAIRESVRQDVINTQTWAHHEQLRMTASLFQELVAVRESLHRDIGFAVDAEASSVRDQVRRIEQRLERIESYAYKSAARFAVGVGDGAMLIRTAVGYVHCNAEDSALVAHLIEAGELEQGTRHLIERIVLPGSVFVDVGANIGMHTVAAARAMRGKGRVVAFEPFPRTFELLDRTLWMNGLSSMCELHEAAVSNEEGQQALFLGRTSGHNSLFPLTDETKPSGGEVRVRLVTLDGVLGSTARVDVLKIDAEGAELDVVRGARGIIESNRHLAMIVELGAIHLARTGHSVATWLAEFAALGFTYDVINPISGQLESTSLAELEASESVNLYMHRLAAS